MWKRPAVNPHPRSPQPSKAPTKTKNNLLSMTCNLLAEATMSFLESLSCKYPFLKWKDLESLGVANVQCSL